MARLVWNLPVKSKRLKASDQSNGSSQSIPLLPSVLHPRRMPTTMKPDGSAIRRRCSAYRRWQNHYAKTVAELQRAITGQRLIHNWIRPHWSLGNQTTPAIVFGILYSSDLDGGILDCAGVFSYHELEDQCLKIVKMISRRKVCELLFYRGTQALAGVASASLLSCQSKNLLSYDRQTSAENIEMLTESSNFLAEVKRLKKLALPKNSNFYQPPTDNDLKKIRNLATTLISLDLKGALNQANALNYEIVRFVDVPTNLVLYGLREKRMPNQPLRGWGSYFINICYSADVLIEVPHVLFDGFSEEIGAKVFLTSAARGFLIAGAHRNANGTGTVDVCNPIKSIFQEVHKAWVLSKTKTWQIHGFSISTKPKFPASTQAVLSDGEGNVTSEILDLSQRMNASGFRTHIYNKLSASAPLNQLVNRSIAGTAFSPLAATEKVQGIYCHSV